MKAYLLTKAGKPDVLQIHEVPEPEPSEKEVKVKIATIGLNYAEILSRRGQYSWAPKKPYIPGMEAFGEVVAIGRGVKDVKVGDHVVLGQQYGCYAEYTCVPEHLTFPALPDYSPEENAALLVNFVTAWVALVKQARVTKGESVLIHAAAGGVGTAAVQLAKSLGCEVFGTASNSAKLELIKRLGAHHAINYVEKDFADEVKAIRSGIDVVLEVVGGDIFRKSVQLLNPFGRLVVIGYASIKFKKWNPITWWKTWKDAPKVDVLKMARGSYGISASHIGYLTGNREIATETWKEMSSFIQRENIRPHVGKVFAFEDLSGAHAWVESRESTGKVVLKL